MSEQETVLRFRGIAREKLSFWLADIIDEMMFLAMAGVAFTFRTDGSVRTNSRLPDLKFAADVTAPTTNRKSFAGGVAATTSLTSTDKMTWGTIVQLRTRAERKRIKPIMDRGRPYYVLILSTEGHRDLRLDPTFQTIASRSAERGMSKNPLFTNADIVVDGIVVYRHQKAFNTIGAASGSKYGAAGLVDGAQGLLMGAQALGMATIDAPTFEEESEDYGNRDGIAYGRMFGLKKPVFKSVYDSLASEDFGVMSLYYAAAEVPS